MKHQRETIYLKVYTNLLDCLQAYVYSLMVIVGITKNLSLLESHGCSDLLILDGGYENFLKLYPYLCTNRYAYICTYVYACMHVLVTLLRQYHTEAQLGELYTYPSVIVPGKLYLGSWKHSANEVILQHLKVTHIVNLTLDYDEL